MLSRVWSATTLGIRAIPVDIETNVEFGMPKYTVVGLPNGAVRESRDRVLAAVRNAGFMPPRGVVTVNLAPADVRKEGSAFDLPIALGLLAASGVPFDASALRRYVVVGELSLDGHVRPVRGALPMALMAREEKMAGIVVPPQNAAEAAVVEGIATFPVKHLSEAVSLLTGHGCPAPKVWNNGAVAVRPSASDVDLADVRGQHNAKRALEVAAAGGHNVLMVGSPGAGKTMLARRLPTILPELTRDEAIETTTIHSVGGRLSRKGLLSDRPFRAPHHTISDAGLCGGGSPPKPGEISLAHNGVLFLDELPEFKRRVLEVLRQPMEEGLITISRARVSVEFPARFLLVASMNPCPCGYLTDPVRSCVCSASDVRRYSAKISGPLLDRIDLHIDVRPVAIADLERVGRGESSSQVRERIRAARTHQSRRFGKDSAGRCNADMSATMVRRACRLDRPCRKLLRDAVSRVGLSARAYHRILKVARTIADLDQSDSIGAAHLAEAIQYRSRDP